MKKVLIISTKTDTYTNRELLKYFEKKKINSIIATPEYLLTHYKKFNDIDLIVHRDTGILSGKRDLQVLEKYFKTFTTINSMHVIKTLRGKWQQFNFCKQTNINFVETLKFVKETSKQDFYQKCQQLESEKFVIKMNHSLGGIGVNRCHTIDDLWSLWLTFVYMNDTDFVIQPFYELPEKRMYMIRDQLFCILSKHKVNSFVSNKQFNQNWSIDRNKVVSQRCLDVVKKLYQELKSDYLAIDFFIDENCIYLLDINTVCGLEMIDKTFENGAHKFISQILSSHF